MRFRATLSALLIVASVGASMAVASGLARAQTPTATPTATPTTAPLAACPSGGTLTVAPPTAAAPSTVTVTITPALANLKAASAADPASLHLHYFVDTPAAATGTPIPTGNTRIIHSGSLTQDLGALGAGTHTVIVVVGQLDHRACDLRGQVTFTTAAQAATPVATTAPVPPKTGSGGLLSEATEATSSPLALAALAFGALVAAGGAALATRRR